MKTTPAFSVYDPHDSANREIRHSLRLGSFIGMILLPLTVDLLLNFVYAYYFQGNTAVNETVRQAIGYVINGLQALVPYVILGLTQWGLYTFGARQIRSIIVMAYIGFFIPYVSNLIVIWATASTERMIMALANLVLYPLDALILTLILLLPRILVNLREGRKKKRGEAGKSHDPLHFALCCTAIIVLATQLVTEVYYTVTFLHELSTVYYSTMSAEEAVSMVSGYLLQFLYAVIGYAVMRVICRIYDRKMLPYLNGEDNF